MKTVVKHLVAAVLFGVVAGLFLAGGRVERRLAAAQRDLATLNLAAPARSYEEIAPYLDYAERIPWMCSDLRHDIRARHAAIRYWQSEYDSLVADYRDPNSPDARNNLALQFIVANAAYRASQRVESGRQEVLGALDRAIGVYFRVLQNSVGHVDAAFNYEYVIRLRDDIARGGELPEGRRDQDILGREGDQPEDAEMEEIIIYVPLGMDEMLEMEEEPTIGEGRPIRRRG